MASRACSTVPRKRIDPEQGLGAACESHATKWLEARGLKTIARNFRCRGGELDLVMRDGKTLVFVEVRYRASMRFGGAAASIDHRKQARLVHAAQVFMQRHAEARNSACRFDVIAMSGTSPAFSVDWIRDAFTA